MERVWGELKKIDAQANKIKSDAQDKAKKIDLLAKSDAEKLIVNGKTYAEEESQKLYSKTIQEANQERDEHLKINQETVEKLKAQAEKNMDQAVLAIYNAVLEETKPWVGQSLTRLFSPKSERKEANCSVKTNLKLFQEAEISQNFQLNFETQPIKNKLLK